MSELLLSNPYLLILVLTLLLSPFILSLASNQNKKVKLKLRSMYLLILIAQTILGLFNWENFTTGRSGFELAISYPQSILGLFFITSLIQILLLIFSKALTTQIVILNFINTAILFFGMIRIGQITGIQAVSWANVGAVFAVLIGNVIGLAYINKDKNLLKKYVGQKGFSLIPILVVAGIVIIGAIYYFQKTPLEEIIPEQVIPSTTGMTKNQAVENVKKLPEVQEYLKEVPNGKVEVDNELEGEYNVHVYEVKNGHTATFNWYKVSIKTGKPEAQFPLGEGEETPKTNKGTVSGKLCYPSEVVPKGTIEAKRLSDGKVFILDHGSSLEDELGNKYSFRLEKGDYYLRYKTSGGSIGYSTTVCPTGQEETCGDKKQRELVKIAVEPNQESKNYDLCDYYYTDSNTPKF